MERNPRAPNLYCIACSTMYTRASCSNVNETPSISKSFSYCFTNAFLGSVKIDNKAVVSNGFKYVTTGRRPNNSGIRPNDFKSWAVTYFMIWSFSNDSWKVSSPEKPIGREFKRFAMWRSMPSKAPPQMNKMFSVLTAIIFWSGCLRPPCGGTFTIDPSNNFKSAC